MQYETAAQAAERFGVTIRMVQIWAKEGKLPGATKHGRDWLIPEGIAKPGKETEAPAKPMRTVMPLINSSYIPGKVLEYIEAMEDEDSKKLALAEYYHFTGQAEKAVAQTELFFNHDDIVLKMSACLIYSFAQLSLGNVHLTRMAMGVLKETIEVKLQENPTPQFASMCLFVSYTSRVLLHLQPPEVPLSDYIKFLPKGLQIWAYYILAHQAYLTEDYNKALGIVETVLTMEEKTYPIPMIYINLAAAMSLMALRRVDEAKVYFNTAWQLALPDNLIEGFGEHHGLLYGLIETCLKDAYPDYYENIIKITYNFSETWRKIHNPDMKNEVADNLSTTEFAIAMLANKGWSNQEIATHMKMSLHTVKKYISVVFQKLAISSRSELKKYMLR